MSASPSPSSRPPVMTDVAALAGVSHQTVSRVLNNKGKVRPETQQRVLAAIEHLGYRRNEAARALATSRSNILGIITTTFVSFGPSRTLLSVELAASRAGYLPIVAAMSDFSAGNLHEILDRFLGQGAMGIVVVAPVEEVAAGLESFPLPVPSIALSSSWSVTESPIVQMGVDQEYGTRLLINHLVGAGVRDIAHLAGPPNWFDSQQREQAWRQTIEEAGLAPGRLMRGDWAARSGYDLTKRLAQEGLPEAIFAANDQMALGTLHALREEGVAVPERVRVVGFDCEDSGEFFNSPLTTVRQDFSRLGGLAIEALDQLLRGERVENRLISPRLVVRKSG